MLLTVYGSLSIGDTSTIARTRRTDGRTDGQARHVMRPIDGRLTTSDKSAMRSH